MGNKKTPAVIVRVTRPELTPDERAERMAEIKRAATGLIVATMKNQRPAV
jgi:hypothetical protein